MSCYAGTKRARAEVLTQIDSEAAVLAMATGRALTNSRAARQEYMSVCSEQSRHVIDRTLLSVSL